MQQVERALPLWRLPAHRDAESRNRSSGIHWITHSLSKRVPPMCAVLLWQSPTMWSLSNRGCISRTRVEGKFGRNVYGKQLRCSQAWPEEVGRLPEAWAGRAPFLLRCRELRCSRHQSSLLGPEALTTPQRGDR